MNYLLPLFFLISFGQRVYASRYLDSLDNVIDQKIIALADSSYHIAGFTKQVQHYLTQEISLSRAEQFCNETSSVVLCFADEMDARLDQTDSNIPTSMQDIFKDLHFALGAKLYMYYLACAQQLLLDKAFSCYEILDFWKDKKFDATHPSFSDKIIRSFSLAQDRQTTESNIADMQKLVVQINRLLGLFVCNQQRLEKAQTKQEFQAALLQAVQLQNQLLADENEQSFNFDINIILKKSIRQISRSHELISSQYAACQIPCHFHRYCNTYAFTGTITAALGCLCASHGNSIIDGAQYFWHEHVQGAVERNVKTFSGFLGAPQLDTMQDERDLLCMIEEELQQRVPTTTENYINFWQSSQNFSDCSYAEKKEKALDRVRVIVSNPGLNLQRLVPALALKSQVEMLAVKAAANEVLKDLHTTFGLTALIPALSLVAGGIFASKSLYNGIVYKSIRALVYKLELFFNQCLYAQHSFENEGYVYVITEQLKRKAQALSMQEQKMMYADIEQLQSSCLDYQQKFNVVQRMYRTYTCLNS